MYTTLNKIKKHSPCSDGWKKLLEYLGKTKADDEPLSLLTVLESNGFENAFWCLRAVEGYEKEKRLFAVWCMRQIEQLLLDIDSVWALNVAERFAHGQATAEELWLARDAAWGAAGAVAGEAAWWAAGVAAWDAAWNAAGEAAGEAARSAQEAEFRQILAKTC